jgi:hypothetical protein
MESIACTCQDSPTYPAPRGTTFQPQMYCRRSFVTARNSCIESELYRRESEGSGERCEMMSDTRDRLGAVGK